MLSLISRVFLSSPPTSTVSERKFKIGKLIQKDRPPLHPEYLETPGFMNYNLRTIGYSLNLPLTPPAFVLPNAMCYEEARAQSESNIDVEDEIESID